MCALVLPMTALPGAAATDTSTSATAPGPAGLYLVTLAGPGTAGRSAGQPVAAFRAAERVAQDAHPGTRRRRRPGLPLDHRPQRLRRASLPGPGPGPRDRPGRGPGRARRRTPAGRAPGNRRGLGADDLPQVGRRRRGDRHGRHRPVAGQPRSSPTSAASGRAPRDFRGRCATGPGWDAELCDRKIVGAHWFVAGFRCRPGAHHRQPVAPRRRRPRHPDGLDRGRQRRRQRDGPGPAGRSLLRRRAAGAAGRLQGLLDRPRPPRRRLLDGRPGHRHRPGRRRPGRRAQPLRRRRRRDRHRRAGPARRRRGRHRRRRRLRQPWRPWVRRPRLALGHLRRRHHRRDPARRRRGARRPAADRRDGGPPRHPAGPRGPRCPGPGAGSTVVTVALLRPGQPRRRPGRRPDRGLRARPDRPGRQVPRRCAAPTASGMVLVNTAAGRSPPTSTACRPCT